MPKVPILMLTMEKRLPGAVTPFQSLLRLPLRWFPIIKRAKRKTCKVYKDGQWLFFSFLPTVILRGLTLYRICGWYRNLYHNGVGI
jgi:hypothetical protein